MRKISPTHSIHAGWIRYKNKAGLYTAFTVFSIVLSAVFTSVATVAGSLFSFNVFAQNTVIALLAGGLSGLLNVGFAHFARKDEAGQEVEFSDFLLGFKVNVKSLVLVMFATVLCSQIFTLLLPAELSTFQLTEEQSQNFEEMLMAFEGLSEALQAHRANFYLFVLLQLIATVLFAFAPYLASLEGKDALEALKDSVQLTLPNALRILLALFLVVLLAIPIVLLTIGLGILVVLPLIQLVSYDMYAQLMPQATVTEDAVDLGPVEDRLEE